MSGNNGHREVLLDIPTIIVGALMLLGGAALGLFAPGEVIPHPFVLLPIALLFVDTALSAIIAARERRPFNGLLHFVYLALFATILYAIGVLSGLRPELVVLLPLIIRETVVLSRLY
jgi:hypothetical protein